MARRRKYDIVIVIALVLLGIAYGSFSSEFRLRPDMPVEFFDGSRLPPAKRAAEEKIAAAYWACAVKQVQWKYGYASRLPDAPPPEFSVSSSEITDAGSETSLSHHPTGVKARKSVITCPQRSGRRFQYSDCHGA